MPKVTQVVGQEPQASKRSRPHSHLARLLLLGLVAVALPAAAQAASYKVGSFTKSTGGAPVSQAVPHGLGEAPKALILWTNGKTNEAFSGNALFGFGVSDGTTSASVATGLRDATASSYTGNRSASGGALVISDGLGGVLLAEATLSSWDATNFTLNWTTNDPNPYVIHFLAIGGSEISAKVVEWNRATTTGNQAVTGTGFQPDVVIHAEADMTAPGSGPKGVVVLGAMDATGGQWANSIFSGGDGAPPSNTRRAQSAAACLYWAYAGVIAHQASFVSMNADGFTVNHTVNDGFGARIVSLALRGMQARAGSFNKSTGAAPVLQTVTTTGVAPRAVLLASVQNTTAAGVVTEARFGIGASDGTSEGSSAFQDQNAVNPSNVDGIDKTSKVFVKVNNATPTIDAEADMLGFSENGFILDWTTNDAVATQILYLALGDPTTFHRSIGTAAAYTQGTVTVTRGSIAVTGGGATPPDWTPSAGNRGRGDRITVTGQGTYTIRAVMSPTTLLLTAPFTGTSGTYTYSIARAFTGPAAWYSCVAGGACGSANLVTSRRKEMGVMYREGHAAWTGPTWNSTTTSATYDITLEFPFYTYVWHFDHNVDRPIFII